MDEDIEFGNIDYTRIDVDKTASYASLEGRVVVITGGGQGIGRGYAHYFAAQGAIPAIAEIDGDNARRVAAEVEREHGPAFALETDVGDEDSVAAMAARTLDAFGRIDILINNAAVFSRITMAPFWELPVEEWKAAMHVNITGSMLCARAVVPAMMEAGWGRIVNISSGTHKRGRPNYLHYITSKSAMVGMSRSMARELGGYGITVNTFWPGVMQTEIDRPSVPRHRSSSIHPGRKALPRQGRFHELAKRCFICSDEGVTSAGQNSSSWRPTSSERGFHSPANGLWGEDGRRRNPRYCDGVEADGLRLIRLAWVDSHGAVRAKSVTPRALQKALVDGYNINVATSTLDASGGRVFASFTQGGGMGLDEMTGSPNLVLVPDPTTFRALPWAPGVGWMLGDQYFRSGKPFPFSTRRVLETQRARLEEADGHVVELESDGSLRGSRTPASRRRGGVHQGGRGRPPSDHGRRARAPSTLRDQSRHHARPLRPLFETFEGLG